MLVIPEQLSETTTNSLIKTFDLALGLGMTRSPVFDLYAKIVANLCNDCGNKFLAVITLECIWRTQNFEYVFHKVSSNSCCFLVLHRYCDKKFRESANTG